MKTKKAKAEREKESSSSFFQSLRPKFLDWEPPTEEEKALAVKARRKLGSAATWWYHLVVTPVGSSEFSQRSPNEPMNSRAIGKAR